MKIFNLSFSKTGTTSFEHSLTKHGFNVKPGHYLHFDHQFLLGLCSNENINELLLKKIVDKYDVLSDSPFCNPFLLKFYKKYYFNSYFILITRNSDKWVNSLFNMLKFKDENITLLDKIYSKIEKNKFVPLKKCSIYGFCLYLQYIFNLKNINKNEIKKKYENYNKKVINFFNNNKNLKFIHLDLEDINLSKKIGKFLNLKSYNFGLHNVTNKI